MAKIYSLSDIHDYSEGSIEFLNGVAVVESQKSNIIDWFTLRGYELSGLAVLQVETATVIGTITTAGNATVIVTAAGMAGSPKTISVPVALNDTAAMVAGKIRTALMGDTAVTALYTVGGSNDTITLTRIVAAVNDTTLNINIGNGTCAGLTATSISTNTTVGALEKNSLSFWDKLTKEQCLEFALSVNVIGASTMSKKNLVAAIESKVATIV